ncbi:MAG: glycosyltransferase family 2 protein [Luteibaculum sp.]
MVSTSVIIVNYNTWQLTENLCRNILENPEIPDLEVIVVDNNSREKAPNFFTDTYNLKLISSAVNKGFAGGINLGVPEASNPIVTVLNSDIKIQREYPFFGPLIKRLDSKENAVVSPKIIYEKDRVIQFAGFTPINKFTGRGFAIGYHQKDRGQYDIAKPMPRAHGAAIAFKKSVWEKLGGFPEHYFLYYEEMAFCEMVRNAGYKIWYEPAATALHIGSFSMLENATPKVYYIFRNRIWYLREHSKLHHKLISMPYLLATGLLKSFYFLFTGKNQKAKYIYNGCIDGLFKSWN